MGQKKRLRSKMMEMVKELRLNGIAAISEANLFLEKTYLPKMNRKFSRQVADPGGRLCPLGEMPA